jgi:hypothetical protein
VHNNSISIIELQSSNIVCLVEEENSSTSISSSLQNVAQFF